MSIRQPLFLAIAPAEREAGPIPLEIRPMVA
jgi:hypothetical protein